MGDMQVVSEMPMNYSQMKIELDKIKKRDKELNFRATRTEEYLQQVDTIKNPEELFDQVMKLNVPRLKEQHIHKIIDVMPTTVNDLKILLQGYTISLSNESMKKVVDAVVEFLEKKK
ncbi:MAG TPA: hypothetical protein VI564_05775 [Candidatus Nanoarchaeia archaeon]|nr:hypothetical protein [Candidatus Nanoarchaeia archaeon]